MEFCVKLLSLPLWERGLKFPCYAAWMNRKAVAPLVGAWIEIDPLCNPPPCRTSLPLWERGLKYAGQDPVLTD